MKRFFILMLILFCAVQGFAQNGVITELSGTVELKYAGQAAYVPAKAGDTVARDTVVSTGFKSSAHISVGSVVITVRPLTRLSFSEISAADGKETLNVGLQGGRVRVTVDPPAGTRASMTTTSPVATASVRGTEFEFDTEVVTVIEGTVVFQSEDGTTVLVSGGASSEIDASGRPRDPLVLIAEEFQPPPLPGSRSGYRQEAAVLRGTIEIYTPLR